MPCARRYAAAVVVPSPRPPERRGIEHTDPSLASLASSAARARARGWRMNSIATGHDAMPGDPRGTADLIHRISR